MATLATVGELETHLQRTLDPAGAELALTLATGAVRAYCGWDLAREETTFQVDAHGGQVLTLPTLHLVEVYEIRVDGVTVDLDATNVDLPRWSQKGQLYLSPGWARYAVVEADVLHGYEPIPGLVRLVTLDLASRQLNNPEALISATVGQVSKTWASTTANSYASMSTLHERLLDRYSL